MFFVEVFIVGIFLCFMVLDRSKEFFFMKCSGFILANFDFVVLGVVRK